MRDASATYRGRRNSGISSPLKAPSFPLEGLCAYVKRVPAILARLSWIVTAG